MDLRQILCHAETCRLHVDLPVFQPVASPAAALDIEFNDKVIGTADIAKEPLQFHSAGMITLGCLMKLPVECPARTQEQEQEQNNDCHCLFRALIEDPFEREWRLWYIHDVLEDNILSDCPSMNAFDALIEDRQQPIVIIGRHPQANSSRGIRQYRRTQLRSHIFPHNFLGMIGQQAGSIAAAIEDCLYALPG